MSDPFRALRRAAYGVIYADPPWQFQGYASAGVPQRKESQHYATMTLDEIAALPVWQLAAPDCALFMWVISSHLPQALDLGARWGFTYSSKAFTWAKLNKHWYRAWEDEDEPALPKDPRLWFMGLGHGTRRQTEDCLLFTRGSPKRLDRGVRELIVSPVREHSRKPDEAYDRIEGLFSGPRVELFARSRRPGWAAWGDQAGQFGGVE